MALKTEALAAFRATVTQEAINAWEK
jgi:hypothetical protein